LTQLSQLRYFGLEDRTQAIDIIGFKQAEVIDAPSRRGLKSTGSGGWNWQAAGK